MQMHQTDILKLIKSPTQIIGSAPESESIHLFLCADNAFAMPMGVTITSVIENNLQHKLCFHIFTLGFDDKNQEKLQEIVHNTLHTIIIYDIDEQVFNQHYSIPKNKIAMCFRLFAPVILQDVTDRLIYIDSDILCLNDLNVLTQQAFEQNIIMAVPDAPSSQLEQCPKLSLPQGSYFNSGVMYINIVLWIKENITEKLIAHLKNGIEKLNYPDQDILNIELSGRVKYLSPLFNTFCAPYSKVQLQPDVLFYHYAGEEKPWLTLWKCDLYWQYVQKSPWHNTPLKQPSHPSCFRRYAKNTWKQHRYLSSLIGYWQYIKMKLSNPSVKG